MAEENEQPAKVAPKWILPSGDPEDPIGFNPDDLSEAMEAAQEVVETVREVLNQSEQVLALLVGMNDPLSAALDVIADQLVGIIDSLLETGLFFYPILPQPKWESLLRPFPTGSAMAALVGSLSDEMDSERPEAPSQSAYAGVVLLAGSNVWHDFMPLLRLLQSFMREQGKWGRMADMWDAFKYKEVPQRAHRNSQGTTWDWSSWRLEEIHAIEKALLKLRGMILGFKNASTKGLRNFLKMLTKRINYYLRVLQELANFAEFIIRLSQFKARCYVLPLASQSGGAEAFARDINTATDKPEFEMCCGIALVGFGTDVTFFDTVKAVTNFVGVTEDEWGNALQGFEQALE